MSSFLVSSTDSLFNGSFFRAGRAPGLSSSLSLLRDSTDSLMLGPVASSFPLLGEQEGEEEREGVSETVEDEGEASPVPGEGEAPGLRADLRWSASSGDEGAQSREEEEQVAYEAYAAAAASSSVVPSLMAGVERERERVRQTVQVLPVPPPAPTPLVLTTPSAPPRPTTSSSSSPSSSSSFSSPLKRREAESEDEDEDESESESERRGRKPVAYGTTVSLSGLQMDPAAPVALRRVRLTKMHLLCVSLETMDEFMCKCEQELAGPAITGAEQRELRRQRRLVRNRIYAAESRKRKRREIAREKSDLTTLRAENDGLRERVRELEAQLAAERGVKRGRR